MKLFSKASLVAATAMGTMMGVPTATNADIVHADDVIIQFSLCVGNDCVNGENFGFDTLRLKENNLRIHFQDTSNSASFPTNDWRIVANDSSNGGGNYLAIEDSSAGRQVFRVDAGAPANSLRVDSAGDVGIGTSNPVVELHVADGDSPTLRLEQNGSSGFTPQTWDVAGNEANFFIRDVTNGSQLPFRIKPGADSDALYIDADNQIGMGTSNPQAYLHADSTDMNIARFSGNGIKLMEVISNDNNAVQYRMQTDSGNRRMVAVNNSGSVETQLVFDNDQVQIAGPTNNGANLWAVIDANGITTQGPSCNPGPCDRTFDAEYFDIPSIEEHAAFMWENQYLWGVGPTSPDQPYNVTEKTAGMLHELEVAHIYIEQLNNRLTELEARYGED